MRMSSKKLWKLEEMLPYVIRRIIRRSKRSWRAGYRGVAYSEGPRLEC